MNPYLIIGAIVALLVSALGGGVIGWHERAVRVPAELTAQQDKDAKECDKAQQLTKDENDALQKNRDTIAAQLDALKLQHPTACVRVAGSAHVPNSGAKHAAAHGDGLSSDWLRTYAAQCETYRGEVSVCTDFLASERQLVQQAE